MQYTKSDPRSQDDTPYTTLDTYRLTRAAWFALYAPDAGRHDALLADDIPPVYRTLFSAILEGSAGLARIAAAGGPEWELLGEVAQLPRPRLIHTRRPPLPDNPDLAAALFGRVADDLELDGVGTGQWPAPPQHTCAAKEAVGTVITFRGNRTSAARMFNPTWRTCPACRHQRAQRIARQTLLTIGAHGPMTYALMPAPDFRKWTAAQRQRLHRGGDMTHYRAMPQEGGAVFVVATGAAIGAAVPTDRAALHTLMSDHCVTPDGKNCSSSRGYGGRWQRLRGDGRDDDDAHAAWGSVGVIHEREYAGWPGVRTRGPRRDGSRPSPRRSSRRARARRRGSDEPWPTSASHRRTGHGPCRGATGRGRPRPP